MFVNPVFDCHVHLKAGTPPELSGGDRCVLSAVDESEWETVMKSSNAQVLPACGIHPLAMQTAVQDWQARLERLSGRLAAIGEIGLDFSVGRENVSVIECQISGFLKQLQIAETANLPVVLHIRQAWDSAFRLMRRPLRGVVHNFTSSREVAEQCLEYGLYLSFSSIVINPNARRLRKLAASIPVDKLLFDSDYPYGKFVAGNLEEVAVAIAEERKMSPVALLQIINDNFNRLFGKSFNVVMRR